MQIYCIPLMLFNVNYITEEDFINGFRLSNYVLCLEYSEGPMLLECLGKMIVQLCENNKISLNKLDFNITIDNCNDEMMQEEFEYYMTELKAAIIKSFKNENLFSKYQYVLENF